MTSIVQYSVNIAMEATIILLLATLIITLFWQKNLFTTTIPFIILSVFLMVLLVVQIITWSMLIRDVPLKYGLMPMRIVFVLDYIFSYGVTVAFYYYVEALAIDGYKSDGITYEFNRNIKTNYHKQYV